MKQILFGKLLLHKKINFNCTIKERKMMRGWSNDKIKRNYFIINNNNNIVNTYHININTFIFYKSKRMGK